MITYIAIAANAACILLLAWHVGSLRERMHKLEQSNKTDESK
jgi:hypothetical protein